MTSDAARGSVVAVFNEVGDAENALRELRDDGFTASRLGCATGQNTEHESTRRSFWQKVEGFFSGEEGYENRDTGSGDGAETTGPVVDRTLTLPNEYNERLNSGCAIVAVYGEERIDRAEQILVANNGDIERNFQSLQGEATTGAGTSQIEGGRIQLLSEVLQVNKQRVNTGEVRLRKEIHTEQQNIQVPVTREELVIERVPVESQAATGQVGTNEEIRVPLSEERVEVEKRPVVREEVRVGKRAVEETRNVSDQTRHEELKVEKSGNVAEDLDTKRSA